MRKTRGFLLGPAGETNFYHVVSRVAGRELLFGDEDKEVFRILLLKQLKFTGLRALAWPRVRGVGQSFPFAAGGAG